MEHPIVLPGESVNVHEVQNPASDPRIRDCLHAYFTAQFGGRAFEESIDSYRESMTPGSPVYSKTDAHGPTAVNCLAVFERAERAVAVAVFGRANDPSVREPEAISFNAAASGHATGEADLPPIGWVQTVAWDPTLSPQRRERVIPFLLRAVSRRMHDDGYASAGFAALSNQTREIAAQATDLGVGVGILHGWKSPPGDINHGLRSPEAKDQLRRTVLLFNVGLVRRTLEEATA